ncbi:SapC family protein [Paracoccaceae bacterium Fryx2]|nr:SapC family protein [Paracoccaceae bacterium Fryx2]
MVDVYVMIDEAKAAQPVSWVRHGAWSWQMPDGYAFALDWRSVAVTHIEVVSAASCFVLVFVPGPAGIKPHVLLRRGSQGRSAFIGQDGQWQAAWLPPRLAAWPFDLVEVPGGGHALALNEQSGLVSKGSGQHRMFTQSDGSPPILAPQTAQTAALLKGHAEALPATVRAAKSLRDLGLLAALDGDGCMLVVDASVAATLDEAAVVTLHRSGALGLLHAGLVSLAHLGWMAKAERLLSSAPLPQPLTSFNRKHRKAGAGFLSALATDASGDEPLIQFPGLTRQ